MLMTNKISDHRYCPGFCDGGSSSILLGSLFCCAGLSFGESGGGGGQLNFFAAI